MTTDRGAEGLGGKIVIVEEADLLEVARESATWPETTTWGELDNFPSPTESLLPTEDVLSESLKIKMAPTTTTAVRTSKTKVFLIKKA